MKREPEKNSRVYNKPIQRPALSWLVSLIGRTLCRYRRGQGPVRFSYKPEFLSGFLFATAKVAYITAMIFLHITFHSEVHIYDFHIFRVQQITLWRTEAIYKVHSRTLLAQKNHLLVDYREEN